MAPTITRGDARWSNAAQDRIELAEPDPSWQEQFQAEAAVLRSTLRLSDDVRLEHFGSTAVPDLRAKPVIDMLLIHPHPQVWPQLIAPLEALGYLYWAENPCKDRLFFVKGMPPFGTRRTHHLHVRVPKDAERELIFRDLLVANPELVRKYERLKQRLAQQFPTDRDAYTEGKTEFVTEVLGRGGT